MSLAKARERQIATATEPSSTVDSSLLCRMAGCRNRWTADFEHGKLCSHHYTAMQRGKSQPAPKRMDAIPLGEAIRPYTEPAEREEF